MINALPESAEFFIVILSDPKNATIPDNVGRGKIKDDDCTARASFQQDQNDISSGAKLPLNTEADVWPNPVANRLHIQLYHSPSGGRTKISLMNLVGAKIKEWKHKGHSLTLFNWMYQR